MQTSLLKAPLSAQKNITELASKSEPILNKSTSSTTKTPFQVELARQAKKQSSQPKQAPQVNAQNKTPQNTQAAKPSTANKQEAATKVTADEALNQVATAAQDMQSSLTVSDQLDGIELSLAAKGEKDASVNARALSFDDLTTQSVASPNLGAIAHIAALLNSQNTLTSAEANTNTQLSLGVDTVAKTQKNLDTMLGNALSQAKSTHEKGAVDSADSKARGMQRPSEGNFENIATKATVEDLSANKSILNAVKEFAGKEVANNVTTVHQVPAAQVASAQANNPLAAQQAGSANTINVFPGKTGWDQAISQKVMWMVGAGEQSASLTLNPPDLGPLKVVIHVHNNQADATFISDNDEVRKALEHGLSNLRDRMQESGIQLGQANVSTSQQSQQGFQQAEQNRALTQAQSNANLAQAETAVKTSPVVRVANGLVDTFA
ncbi:MAG: flagellar hook-length control protein FliK [Methylotenera sp.]|nr:flagellar hook-length control protein FliK [Methylotenera sp.]MDP2402676.1 flagellar hook-length control protein FliK [Methylotenera sp.]MDP3095728.1 flagellar hook-length control protein FliK [Methylotenera sp.]MDZ4222161.1 flagellar hook-length control protein FliK [Methylotenera sp.]